MSNIRQFKLSTGEEIVCQILEWADEDEVDIVVRYVYQLRTVDDDVKGIRYYNLKPWMTMQEGDEKFITMNSMHVISQARPDERVLEQFKSAVETSQLTEEELIEKVHDYIENMKTSVVEEEEDNNVIRFPKMDKDKLH